MKGGTNIIKPIPKCNGYFADEKGNIYSTKTHNQLHRLSPWLDSQHRYKMVSIGNKKRLVHRLVAETFIENPNHLPEVNHIDYDTFNNAVANLEWCNRKQNMAHCFKKYSPVRNYKQCYLYKGNELVKQCKSVAEAGRIANQQFGISSSSLTKYKYYQGYSIKFYKQ